MFMVLGYHPWDVCATLYTPTSRVPQNCFGGRDLEGKGLRGSDSLRLGQCSFQRTKESGFHCLLNMAGVPARCTPSAWG